MKEQKFFVLDIQPGQVTAEQAEASYADSNYAEIHGDPELVKGAIAPFRKIIQEQREQDPPVDLIQVSNPDIIERIKQHRLGKGIVALIANHEGLWDQNWIGAALEELDLGEVAHNVAVSAKADDYFIQGNRENMQRLGAVHTFRSHIYGSEIAQKAMDAFNNTFVLLATKAKKNVLFFPHGRRTVDPDAQIKSGPAHVIHRIQNAKEKGRHIGKDVGILDLTLTYGGNPNTTPPIVTVGNFKTDFKDNPAAITKYIEETLRPAA